MLTVTSLLRMLAMQFFASWIIFPRPIIVFVNPYNGTAIEAPAGTRIHSDGSVSVPGLPDLQPPSFDRNAKPFVPESTPQPAPKAPAPKSDGGKDQNAPRK